MPQFSQKLNLDFATLYQCAIKPFKSKPQNYAVSVLLDNDVPESANIADATCTNYVKRARAIPDSLRSSMATISADLLGRKLEAIGIIDFYIPMEVLRRLIDRVKLSKGVHNTLTRSYDKSIKNDKPLQFLAEVFKVCSSSTDNTPLSKEDLAIIDAITRNTDSSDSGAISPHDKTAENTSDFDPDDEEWMREYVTNQIPLNKKQFFGSPVNMYRQTLTLPADYAPLLFVLKPAFVGAPFDTFKYQDFVRIMDIDPVSGTMKTGQLKCIKFTGQVEEIASSIKDLNLKDVCSCVLIMCGRITISEAEMIHEAIIESSNPEINYLRALTSDSTLPETEVSLVLKFDRDVAATQIANEDVKAYHVNHKNDLQQKQIFFLNN